MQIKLVEIAMESQRDVTLKYETNMPCNVDFNTTIDVLQAFTYMAMKEIVDTTDSNKPKICAVFYDYSKQKICFTVKKRYVNSRYVKEMRCIYNGGKPKTIVNFSFSERPEPAEAEGDVWEYSIPVTEYDEFTKFKSC